MDDVDSLDSALGPGNYGRLASLLDVERTHVSRFLRGRVGASFDLACRLADAAGVTLDSLRRYVEANRAHDEGSRRPPHRSRPRPNT